MMPRTALLLVLVGLGAPVSAAETFALHERAALPEPPTETGVAPESADLTMPPVDAPSSSPGAAPPPVQRLDLLLKRGGLAAPAPTVDPAPDERSEPVADGSDPTALLNACWTPAQLAGSPTDRTIQHGLKPDRTPPPAWAVRAAESALPPLAPELKGSIRSVEPTDPQERLVALTFDLCEQAGERAGYDAELVDALRAQGVKATFMAGGKWLRTHPEQAMQLMADPRFEIGNHTWTHANLRVVDGPAVRDQIVWTQAEYQVLRRALAERPCAQAAGPAALSHVPAWPAVFRFPYGTCNQGSLDVAAGLGLPSIQWSIVTGDPDKGQSAAAIARTVLAGVKGQRGAIVVAHANGRGWNTARALPLFIPQLRKLGYRFVTVSELLAAGRPVAVEECFEVRPGDSRRYDALFRHGGKR
ncbi:polysaccharide deacetylase family protein [uncultured Thiodictyon sp.]|uniref:polysaccharide deacetylase family protein n=1 Tax=uncultured Thiodictyon sp. TaxID=1846217 RepID=UPI0025CD72D0|nr:polysaccharide deacetylase family protein [uncultured Thiodictyon sp.]